METMVVIVSNAMGGIISHVICLLFDEQIRMFIKKIRYVRKH